MIKFVNYIKNKKLGVVYTNKMFKQITTLRIGGSIKILYFPNTIDNFIIFYNYYINNISNNKIIVIGNGSNILANSKDYDGIVVCFKNIKYKYSLYKNNLIVTSGVMITDVINYCKKKNLGGLEKLSYIPGTVGGMVKMNASAYNTNISDNILWVKVMDHKGCIKILYKKEIDFSYRSSDINDIILECCFQLNNTDEDKINSVMNFVKENRKLKQPIDCYNAGSTFKNFKNINTWKLIDELGLRGFSINDAEVSKKHCNFLINKKNCTSDDMCKLIEIIKNKIYDKYFINIQCEWIFINF